MPRTGRIRPVSLRLRPLHPWAGIGNKRWGFPIGDAKRFEGRRTVPTLFRFVALLALLGGLVFGGMVALVTFVQPVPREMVETVPPSKLQPK
jgi:hypothetical protein